MNVANWLADAADRLPGNPALLQDEHLVADYAEFRALARQAGRRLAADHGIMPGDRVAVFMKNATDYLVFLYGIWWCGAVVVPINCKLHSSEAAEIIRDADARLVFTDGGAIFGNTLLIDGCLEITPVDFATGRSACSDADALARPVSRAPDDLAWLFYTSGTTGKSKGVMLSHGNLTAMSLCYPIDVEPVTSNDAILYCAPMSHGAGLYNFIFVRTAARHVVPASRGFDPDEIFRVASVIQNVSFFAAPTMVKRLVDVAERQGLSGEGIRAIILGGAPMYRADLERALAIMGPKFIQIYGQGESPMTITALSRDIIADRSHPEWQRFVTSVGHAQSCVEIRVLSETGEPVTWGVRGEVAVRGGTVMKGYWRNKKATDAAIVDGWLLTGDIGYLDEDGLLTLTDRSKDVVISGGSNIYPREVEEVLALHPDVKEVAIVGQRDPEWGEVVVAFVALRPQSQQDEESLLSWFVSRMASFKKPRRFVFVPELPKNGYGKIAKTELRALLESDKPALGVAA
jgi:long-chain acyl-CoA synthetase